MRFGVEGLCSPRPFMDTMPLVYRGDPLSEQLCDAFDDVLAPIFATLDCFIAYLDPKTAPADMLDWLAGWIGLTVSGHQEPARKRELITAGAELLPWRGTVRSVHEAVVAAFNRETEVIESGSATWSTTPNSEPAGQPVPTLIVRVTVDSADDIDQRSLDGLVESVKPAHIPHRVELVIRGPQPAGDGAHAAGGDVHAKGGDAHAAGDGAHAAGDGAHAAGDGAHAAGDGAQAAGDGAHAAGGGAEVSGDGTDTSGDGDL